MNLSWMAYQSMIRDLNYLQNLKQTQENIQHMNSNYVLKIV